MRDAAWARAAAAAVEMRGRREKGPFTALAAAWLPLSIFHVYIYMYTINSSCAVLRAPVSLLFGHVISPLSLSLALVQMTFFFLLVSRRSCTSLSFMPNPQCSLAGLYTQPRTFPRAAGGRCCLSQFPPRASYYLPRKQRNNRFWWTCGLFRQTVARQTVAVWNLCLEYIRRILARCFRRFFFNPYSFGWLDRLINK